MTPEEFAATRFWCSMCLGEPTYIPLAENSSELATAEDDSAIFNPTDLLVGIEEWMDKVVQLGAEGIWFTAKHWDGLCLWPSQISSRNIANTPWYTIYPINILHEILRQARQRGLFIGVYFCVTDKFFEASGTGTYTDWTIGQLTEILNGDYGEIDFLTLDGWGDTWSTGFVEVDYPTVIAAIESLSDCLISVNDHEYGTSLPYHSQVAFFERNLDGIPPPGIDRDTWPVVICHDAIHTDGKWFRHEDSPTDTVIKAQEALSHMFLTVSGGYTYMANFSLDPDGRLGADTLTMLDAMRELSCFPTLSENFALAATEAPPVNLEAHDGWTKFYGASSIVIGQSGRAFIHDTGGPAYVRDDQAWTDAKTRLDFKIIGTIPNDFIIYVFGRADGTGARDYRVSFAQSAGAGIFLLQSNDTGLAQLGIAFLADSLILDKQYRLELDTVGTTITASLYGEYNGRLEKFALLSNTSSISEAGYSGLSLLDATGSTVTGVQLTAFTVCETDTTAPISPLLNSQGDGRLQINTFEPVIWTKVYRSDDCGATYKIAGVTDGDAFGPDAELAVGESAYYKAMTVDESWNESEFSNVVVMTCQTPLTALIDTLLDEKLGELQANLPSATEIVTELLGQDNGGATIAEQLANLDAPVSGAGGGGGTLTDPNDEPVPDSRRFKLIPTTDRGLVAEIPKSIMVGVETTVAVDFSADLAANGRIATVDDVILLADSGITISNWGRDHAEAKFRVAPTAVGSYDLEIAVTYIGGSGGRGLITINVPTPQTEFEGGVPGSSTDFELTDINQEPVPLNRTWVLEPTTDSGLAATLHKSLRVGSPAETFAADFRKDLPANRGIASVVSVQLVSGDVDGIEIGEEFGRDHTQAKFTLEALAAGTYVLNVAVIYTNGDGARGQLTIVVP